MSAFGRNETRAYLTDSAYSIAEATRLVEASPSIVGRWLHRDAEPADWTHPVRRDYGRDGLCFLDLVELAFAVTLRRDGMDWAAIANAHERILAAERGQSSGGRDVDRSTPDLAQNEISASSERAERNATLAPMARRTLQPYGADDKVGGPPRGVREVSPPYGDDDPDPRSFAFARLPIDVPPAPTPTLVFEYAAFHGALPRIGAIARRAEQFDYEAGVAVKWHPRGRDSAVVVNPRVSFGSPSVQGVSTYVLRGRFLAGEAVEVTADDFDIPLDELTDALALEGLTRNIA
ncbi:MAG: hypothetical protein EPO26_10805 [Chloroflexota bacterium]|nr:MAG: hypothetical protein EPO26_10805 [Chloroflexota bacterium]